MEPSCIYNTHNASMHHNRIPYLSFSNRIKIVNFLSDFRTELSFRRWERIVSFEIGPKIPSITYKTVDFVNSL